MVLNIYALPVAVAALITMALITALWKYRSTSGVGDLIISLLAGVVYSLFYALEISTNQIELVSLFYKFEYIGIPFIPAFYLFFAIQYSGERHHLSLAFRLTILIIPIITLFMVFTNHIHHFFHSDESIGFNGYFEAYLFVKGSWYWVHQVFAIIAFLLSFLFLLRMWLNSAPIFKKHVRMILIGSLFPFLVYISYLLKVFPWGLDPIPFSIVVIATTGYYGLSRYNLFSLAPLARNLLFDKLPDAVAVFDQDLRMIDCNDRARKLFDISTEQIGREANESFSSTPLIISALTQEKQQHVFEFIHQHQEHNLVLSASISPIIDNHGNKLGKMLIIHDVTERRKVEKERRESEEKFRLIVENAPLGVIYYDKDAVIQICNDEFVRIIGSSREKLVGLNMMKLPDERLIRILKSALSGSKASFEGIYESTTADKTTPVRVLFEAIFSETGEVEGGIGVIEDITERIETEDKIKSKNAELERLNIEKDRFFSIIAHDLRSPFNAFLGFTELMTDDSFELSMDEMKSYAQDIRKSALLLFGLLENLLEWSRLQRLVIADEKFDFPLIRIVTQSIDILRENALKKEITIQSNFDPSITVFVAEKMIQSVFRNLISNAIKFTHRGGLVTIEAAETEDEMVEVKITDTGVGIKAQDIPKLFKIDETHSTAGTEGEPSTGLGLILSREFVEKHGGKIWVKSQVGMGSTFSFTLPQKNNSNSL